MPGIAGWFLIFKDRASDSPYIERVWSSRSEREGVFQSVAACHWELVVSRHRGRVSVIVRGPETKATMAECPADGEWFGIRFRLGTFMPSFLPGDLRNRKDVVLPCASGRSFWLNGSAWEHPNFENAEVFVDRLVRAGLVAEDGLIRTVLEDRARGLSARTEQRRFLRATGMTRGTIHQIERARRATSLLRAGIPIVETAGEAGYYDQAHLTRSLARWTGQTPAQILRRERQLSFLYNTEAAKPVTVGK